MNTLGVFLFCLIVTCRFTYFLNMHYKQHKLSRWALCALRWNVKNNNNDNNNNSYNNSYKFTIAPFNIIKKLSKALYSLKFIQWIYN